MRDDEGRYALMPSEAEPEMPEQPRFLALPDLVQHYAEPQTRTVVLNSSCVVASSVLVAHT